MAYINCDILFSYSKKMEYVGEFNFRNVISMEIQHVFPASGSHPSQGSNVIGVPAMPNDVQEIIVDGEYFGSGRVLSAGIPTSSDIREDGATFWKQVLSVEVSEEGDSSNLGVDSIYDGVDSIYNKNISDVSEDFNFNSNEDGTKTYTHSVSVTCLDDVDVGTKGWTNAKIIAKSLINSTPPFGYAAGMVDLYNAVGKRTYSESVDKFKGSASFTKQFEIQRDSISRDFNFNNGICTVSESVRINNSGDKLTADNAFGGALEDSLNTLLNGANTRCNTMYSSYTADLGDYFPGTSLYENFSDISKGFDETSQQMFYNVVYTNSPEVYNEGFTISRQQTLTKNNIGVYVISENSTIESKEFKKDNYISDNYVTRNKTITKLKNEIDSSKNRLLDYYPLIEGAKTASLNQTISSHGKSASYKIDYSTSKSLILDGTFMSRTIQNSDSLPIRTHSPYIIMGWKKPLVHDAGLTSIGSASSTVTAELARPPEYNQAVPVKPSPQLNTMFFLALDDVLNKITKRSPTEWFVSSCSYEYTSNYSASLTVEVSYIYPRTSKL